MTIQIHDGSIFDVPAEAIVNPANSFLRHGGGLARAIATAAEDDGNWGERGVPGPIRPETPNARLKAVSQWRIDNEGAPLIPTGGVWMTSPGLLPFKHVIHAVGPIWGGGNFLEDDLLEITIQSILDTCQDLGVKSVAVPAISCGIFGFPVEEAANILTNVAGWFPAITTVFALTDPAHVEAFRKAAWR